MTLEIGNTITPLRHINATMVSYWQFAKECADILGGLMPGAELKIVELSKIPGAMWVRVELPGRLPVASLKIAGEEYGNNFRPL